MFILAIINYKTIKIPTEVVYSDQLGLLPFTIDYTPKSNKNVIIQMQGTVFGSGGLGSHGVIGLNCWIDGEYIGNSPICSNAPNVHRTTFPMSVNYKI